MATGSENDFDDDPYCAHCGESVSVKADCEFNEGDLCNECLYVEYPKMKRERDHLESLLAVAVAERDEAKRLLAECWGIFSADEMARIENGKADIARDPDLMKRISVFFRKTAAKGVE